MFHLVQFQPLCLIRNSRHETRLAINPILHSLQSSVGQQDIVRSGYSSLLVSIFVLPVKVVRRLIFHFILKFVLKNILFKKLWNALDYCLIPDLDFRSAVSLPLNSQVQQRKILPPKVASPYFCNKTNRTLANPTQLIVRNSPARFAICTCTDVN